MQDMKATLDHLVHACAGDNRPDCPILADLGGRISASHCGAKTN
jgi:MerR family copper efflux transcriptional regulator